MAALQPGVYFESCATPPPCYRLVLLDFSERLSPQEAAENSAQVMEMLRRLADGEVRDLTDQPKKEREKAAQMFQDLSVLLGFGRRFFDMSRHKPQLTVSERPDFLSYLPADGDAFPAVPWDSRAVQFPSGEADLAIQLTATSEAAVNRAAVEVWKLISDFDLGLTITASFSAFQRTDGRGWLEFHDGVSNIESSDRLAAIEVNGDPDWMAGGTYMAFLRLSVELEAWRSVPQAHQELIVGRDKLTGSPLVAVDRSGEEPKPVAGPVPGPEASDREIADFRDPPQTTDRLLEASHTHRANQNRSSPYAPSGLRIFRQGYDFLDRIDRHGPLLGLNFVSFQSDLRTVQHLLHLPGWLGDANFGGPVEPQAGDPPSLAVMKLLAGGFYAVPPQQQPFPGADLFSGR